LLIGSELGRQRGLYQRAGQVVSVQRVKAIAAGDKPIAVAAICERGDYALLEYFGGGGVPEIRHAVG
jgi:hypothetical protein